MPSELFSGEYAHAVILVPGTVTVVERLRGSRNGLLWNGDAVILVPETPSHCCGRVSPFRLQMPVVERN